MKRLIWGLLATALVSLAALAFWSNAAQPFDSARRSGGDITITQPHDGDLLTAGAKVGVRARVDGDLAFAGRDLVLTAPVEGYVMAAGADVAIDGPVRNDLWAAGRHVRVDAAVGDNVRLAGASVSLQPRARVGGDALLAARSVEVRSPIAGDLRLSADDALLASEVGGTVYSRSGSLKLAPGATVRGDLIARGPNPPEIGPGAQVLGQVRYEAPSGDHGPSLAGWLWQWLFVFLALLALGTAVIAPSGWWGTRVAETLRERSGASLLAGIVALVAVPLLAAVLAATVVGMPLALAMLACLAVALLLSGVFVSLRLGAWVLQRFAQRFDGGASRFARLAAGALLLSLLASLPWIGWLAWLVVPVIGLGALLIERNAVWRGQPARK